MTYQVVVPRQIEKKIKKLDKKLQLRIGIGLLALESDPYSGKKLEGKYKNYYSMHVWPYRIIYEIVQKKLVILIIDIGHRQEIY